MRAIDRAVKGDFFTALRPPLLNVEKWYQVSDRRKQSQ
jgi:hypothetical protein